MDRYRYRAATLGGQLVEGVLEAPSRHGLLEQLRTQRLYPMTVEPMPAHRARPPRLLMGRGTAVAAWARDVATLLDAGIPLDRTLDFSAGSAAHERLQAAVREIRSDVQAGRSFAEALERHPDLFPPVLLAMVRAGEASGALDKAITQAADHLDEAAELRSQLLAALIYPVLMATVAALGVVVLLLFVVPRFSAMLAEVGGTLPLATRMLIGTSALLVRGWWLWLLLGSAAVVWARAALRDPERRQRWDAARLDWPWIGELERAYTSARFTRTLGLLLANGLPIVPALTIARGGVSNRALGLALERAAGAVGEGGALSRALAPVLPPLAVQMIAVGEESGRLDELCLRAARTYDTAVRRLLRTGVALIEPALILVFGALVGFVALAMLQAIYSINAGAL